MEALGSWYMRRKNACNVRCAEAAEPKLTLSMLDHDDPREPTELSPHRPDRGQRTVNRLKSGVKRGIHAVGCKHTGIGRDLDSAANPQATKSFARTMDSSGNHVRNCFRRLSIREQRVAQLVDQELVHETDLAFDMTRRRRRAKLGEGRPLDGRLGDGDMAAKELSDGNQRLARWNAG